MGDVCGYTKSSCYCLGDTVTTAGVFIYVVLVGLVVTLGELLS
jgi:hypothetical protein